MTDPEQEDVAHQPRLTEAARWRVRLAEWGVETTPAFTAWLADPRNREAWKQVSVPWKFVGEQRAAPELVAVRRAALMDAKEARTARSRLGDWRYALAGVAAALLVGLGVWASMLWYERPDEYSTAHGERRVLTLADGSHVSLDSDSDVTVKYTDNARMLRLLRGQARFDVTHDVERPFSVVAGGQKVIATGTAFNIDLNGSHVLVTLIEGHVVVVDERTGSTVAAVPHPAAELRAGQQLEAEPAKSAAIEPADIRRVTAWMNGQLMFDNEPLGQVVERVNRYSAIPIEIHDPKVAALRISGVFNTGDVTGVVETVTQYLPVHAIHQSSGVVVLEDGKED